MPLRIITGRAGTGKTTACLAEMKDRPAILVVPEQYSFRMGKELLKDVPVTGLDGTQVYSFRRLAALLEGEVAGRTGETLSGREKNLFIAHLMLKYRERFEVIRPRLSTANELGELVAEFKKYRVSPQMLRKTWEGMEDSLLRRKLSDVLFLYEEYERSPKADGEDRFARLAKNAMQSDTVRTHEIYIDQFTGFLPQELEVIRALLKTAPRVTVILTMDESEEPPFETVRRTRDDLLCMAKEEGDRVEAAVFEENVKDRGKESLAFLEREYFRYPNEKFPEKPQEVSLFAAKDPLGEITHVAATVTRLLKEGYRYGDMVIMGRNTDEYRAEITGELKRFGIPYFMDQKLPLIRHRAGTAILSAVAALCHGWNSELIFRYLKCGYSALEQSSIDRLENYVLATGIEGNAWYRDEAWDMPFHTYDADDYPDEEEAEEHKAADAWRRIAAAPLQRLNERIRGEKTLREDTEALISFLEELDFAKKLEEESKIGGRSGEEDAQIYQELIGVFGTLCQALGETPVRPDDFYAMLEVGLSQSAVGSIPHSLDHIEISDIARAKGMGAKIVFLIGAVDGAFPQSLSRQGFLNDRNREALAERGIRLAPDSRSKAYMEQNLVYAAISAASHRLYISYSVTDREGEEQFPSRIVERIKELFPKIETENDFLGVPKEDRITTPEGTFQTMLTARRLERDGIAPQAPEYKAAFRWYLKRDEWKEKLLAAQHMEEEFIAPRNLPREVAEEIYGTQLYTSISRLEAYRKCPFQYFAQYALRLGERVEAGMNPMDTGSFLHKIMEDFSGQLEFHGIRWEELTDEEVSRHLEDVLPKILKKCNAYLFDQSPRLANQFLKLRKTAEMSLKVVRNHFKKGAFEPLGYELNFSRDGDLEPITLPFTEGSVTIQGKIDRADRAETENGVYYRVIDYKTGKRDFELPAVYHGISLQLLVYMDTLLQNRQKEGEHALPAAMAYYRLTDPVVTGSPDMEESALEREKESEMKLEAFLIDDQEALAAMDREWGGEASTVASSAPAAGGGYRCSAHTKRATLEQYELLRNHVRETVKEITTEMLGGKIEAKPYRNDKGMACTYCAYRAVCGFDQQIECYRYNELEKMSAKDVWERLEGEAE